MRLRRHSFLKIKEKKNNQEISLNQKNYFLTVWQSTILFDSKKFFLNQRNFSLGVGRITCMYYANAQTFISLIQRKNNQEMSLNQ